MENVCELNKNDEIKRILKNIKDSENTKEKFCNILLLTKNIKDLKENDKIKILKAIDIEFICLLLRSKNEFKLFTLRLINSLVGNSTFLYLKKCLPFINSIIYSYLSYIKNANNEINKVEKKENNIKIYEKKNEEYVNNCKIESEEEENNEWHEDDMKDINVIYNECLIFFLKIQPFLKTKDFIKTTYFNNENNDIDVDVEMYFFNKSLKRKYCENVDYKNEKREVNDMNETLDSDNLNSDSAFSEDEENEENFRSKEYDFYYYDKNICLIELIFDVLKENINIKELKNGKNKIKKEKSEDKKKVNSNDIVNIKSPMIHESIFSEILLNEQNINISLLFLNNIILELHENKFIKEYFYLLNKIVENYDKHNIVTSMNCLTHLNIYIKNKGFHDILDENTIYKFYANIIYLFSQIKYEKEKKVLYKLYSTIYSCLNFMFVNKNSIDILKTPLSYMNVELYLFLEDIIKYVNQNDNKNFTFCNKHFKKMFHLICKNIENIINFVSYNYSLNDGFEINKKIEEKSENEENNNNEDNINKVNNYTNNNNSNFNNNNNNINNNADNNKIKSIYEYTNENKKKEQKYNDTLSKKSSNILSNNNLEINDIYIVISKIKKSIDVLLEFFKDIKGKFKVLNEDSNDFKKFKNEFNEEINLMIQLFCNYLIHENIYYIDDFIKLLEFFAIFLEEKNFFFLLIVKNVHVDRYFNNKIFISKLFLYVFDISLKNIIHVKILFDLFNKCTFNIIEFIEINVKKDISDNSSIIENSISNYDLIENLNISVDKLNNLKFVYTICEDEYNKNTNCNFKENIKNIILFSTYFFFYYYFNILNQKIENSSKQKFDIVKDNYYNLYNKQIEKDGKNFFLSLKILLSISSLLFMRFDAYVLTHILKKKDILFIQDCMILSLLNLKFLNEYKMDNNEESQIKRKKKKYFFQILKLIYFIMYYHPYFISLFIFRLKQMNEVNHTIFFDTKKIKMKEKYISICMFLNNFIKNYV
ncbi:conserved Plasmodium protein, unknown function [Plasmodium gallinaceum]|uniref:Uncharacterized protein n=1 Tax=Plasmodium gallinaceum TaxID=5849 RepID=A0A1J1GVD0_PLAGA|nr:conserved Plasmodium protein, unknown function [Plasmodium gallinaceum]CRG94995.1 conserved Plasmodium protein, unknown function [Plasmodium gallinaceum]